MRQSSLLLLLSLAIGCHVVLPLGSGDRRDTTAADDGAVDLATTGLDPTGLDLTTDIPAIPTLVSTAETQVSGTLTKVPVPGVLPDHAFVVCSFLTRNSEPYNAPTCQLDSAGVTITTANSNASPVVRWHVVQTGRARVQRGQAQLGVNQLDATQVQLPLAVQPDSSFVLVTTRVDTDQRELDQPRLVLARLESPTTLAFHRGEAGHIADIEWQVVQLQGATVQSGDTAIPSGDSSAPATLKQQVDPQRSFLVFSSAAGAAVQGVEARYGVRGMLQDGQSLLFQRGTGGVGVEIHWFVAQLPPGDRVLAGYDSSKAGTSTVPIGDTVDLQRALPLHTSSLEAGSGSSLLDELSQTAHLTDASTLELRRSEFGTTVANAWQVVELAP